MKNWTLFLWAIKRVKFTADGKCAKGIRNNILLRLMDLSGVKPKDVEEYLASH